MAYTNIDDPSAYFQTALYTGNNSNNVITNDGNSDLQPDFIWAKSRTSTPYADNHFAVDSSRGVQQGQVINLFNAATNSVSGTDLKSFNTNGFTVGAVNQTGALNAVDASHVAWQWKCNGGTTSTNNDGNHTSVVQANQDAGFSIVTYTGTGNTSSTVGHGLGVTPNWIIFKRRSGTANWDVQIDGTSRATLNLTEAAATNVLSSFSSTTFGLGSATSNEKNANGSTYLAYCFASKQGYSKFGKYVGNGSANGTFVYLGFKPAFIMWKNSSNAGEYWQIRDTARDPHNQVFHKLFANTATAEDTQLAPDAIDILSNGFKHRALNSGSNGSGRTYIYMAFAENPFVTSTGVPTTAR